jgi:hypothetical protein
MPQCPRTLRSKSSTSDLILAMKCRRSSETFSPTVLREITMPMLGSFLQFDRGARGPGDPVDIFDDDVGTLLDSAVSLLGGLRHARKPEILELFHGGVAETVSGEPDRLVLSEQREWVLTLC